MKLKFAALLLAAAVLLSVLPLSAAADTNEVGGEEVSQESELTQPGEDGENGGQEAEQPEPGGDGSEEESPLIRVTMRLIGAEIAERHVDLGERAYLPDYVTWIATTEYWLDEGASVYDLWIKATGDAGILSEGAEDNYVETVYAPEGYELSEFTNGNRSGWMYTINGRHPGYGIKEQPLHDGDAVIWHYVNDFGYEVEDWFDEGKWQALGDGTYYGKWLEAPDYEGGSGGGISEPSDGENGEDGADGEGEDNTGGEDETGSDGDRTDGGGTGADKDKTDGDGGAEPSEDGADGSETDGVPGRVGAGDIAEAAAKDESADTLVFDIQSGEDASTVSLELGADALEAAKEA
ncbi:MAG: DUF4430 domain-containing protein, partial [Oscillospiraceae bacterium]|nr:DUF4430 domain-containing protein [Oscillospiraceae bacterium]